MAAEKKRRELGLVLNIECSAKHKKAVEVRCELSNIELVELSSCYHVMRKEIARMRTFARHKAVRDLLDHLEADLEEVRVFYRRAI
jgi:hypothetical protein